ncbi:uncharacterized protein BDR25DRAFT_358614 [Lindgomyces ingoldianus]|uniref:Uncharacterized protein n=1 Tax=Lindgomyces ingoldianus TaxID=673940 RepID=A0ACB6QLP2_9PLEO|nr:uncharacterized protein BDR25DRAFT_358614 [Lindgomyces ingoldianus]KAF2467498.1 hypothetical protein BDR25DRAFT_358614 [Lindgomyces ingoldianus]
MKLLQYVPKALRIYGVRTVGHAGSGELRGEYFAKRSYSYIVRHFRPRACNKETQDFAERRFPFLQYFGPKRIEQNVDRFSLGFGQSFQDLFLTRANANIKFQYGANLEVISPKSSHTLALMILKRFSFIKDKSWPNLGCDFESASKARLCTSVPGEMAYYEIKKLNSNKGLTLEFAQDAGMKWLSFDNEELMAKKLEYANDCCFDGNVIWLIDLTLVLEGMSPILVNIYDNSGPFPSSPTISYTETMIFSCSTTIPSSYFGSSRTVIPTPSTTLSGSSLNRTSTFPFCSSTTSPMGISTSLSAEFSISSLGSSVGLSMAIPSTASESSPTGSPTPTTALSRDSSTQPSRLAATSSFTLSSSASSLTEILSSITAFHVHNPSQATYPTSSSLDGIPTLITADSEFGVSSASTRASTTESNDDRLLEVSSAAPNPGSTEYRHSMYSTMHSYRFSFFHVLRKLTDESSVIFELVPSITPPPLHISLGCRLRPFLPSSYPYGALTVSSAFSSLNSAQLRLLGGCGELWIIHLKLTVPAPIPTGTQGRMVAILPKPHYVIIHLESLSASPQHHPPQPQCLWDAHRKTSLVLSIQRTGDPELPTDRALLLNLAPQIVGLRALKSSGQCLFPSVSTPNRTVLQYREFWAVRQPYGSIGMAAFGRIFDYCGKMLQAGSSDIALLQMIFSIFHRDVIRRNTIRR